MIDLKNVNSVILEKKEVFTKSNFKKINYNRKFLIKLFFLISFYKCEVFDF